MFVVIPLVSLGLLVLILSCKKDSCWRSAILQAAMIWGVLLTAITEILSFFKLLSFGWVLGLWLLCSIGLGLLYHNIVKKRKRHNIVGAEHPKTFELATKLTDAVPLPPIDPAENKNLRFKIADLRFKTKTQSAICNLQLNHSRKL